MGRKRKSAKDAKEADRLKKKKARDKSKYREIERNRQRADKHRLRVGEMYRGEEQTRNTKAHAEHRTDPEKLNSLTLATWEELSREYRNQIQDGSCGGLWFERSLRAVTKEGLMRQGCIEDFVTTLLQREDQGGEYKLCKTCVVAASKKEIPKRHLTNGFAYPELPEVLRNLTQLEQRLVSPRIPFMQIRSIGVYLQKGLRGNVVNVENDLDSCAKVLPRAFDDTATVQVMLMRRMKYRAAYLFETVRPRVIFEAAKYLCQTELYKTEGITLSKEWLTQHPDEKSQFIINRKELQEHAEATVVTAHGSSSEDEDNDEINPGADETLIMRDTNMVAKFAPAEGKRPMAWLRDVNAEQLSFPSIYGGVPRKFPPHLKVTATDIARSEARMFDRRAVKAEKILYTLSQQNSYFYSNIADSYNNRPVYNLALSRCALVFELD